MLLRVTRREKRRSYLEDLTETEPKQYCDRSKRSQMMVRKQELVVKI